MPVVSAVNSSASEVEHRDGFSQDEIDQFEAEMHEFLRQQETPSENQAQMRPPSPVEIKEEQISAVPVPPIDTAAQSYRRTKPKPVDPDLF